jgi:hypothetical protein
MYNLIAQVFQRILRILTSLSMTLQLMAHLTWCRSWWLMILTYFHGDFMSYSQLMSQMTLDLSVGTSDTQYEAPRASPYDIPDPFTQVPETQAPSDVRHKCQRHEIWLRDTYITSLIRRIFRQRWCIFFYFKGCSLYFTYLKDYFIFFIYGLKLNFYYLWFEIKLL